MKWFKHFSQAKMDTKLVMIRSEFGMWGIGVYWTLLEFISEQMKGIDPQPVATLSVRELCSFLGCKRNKLESFLKRLQNVRGMNYTLKKDILRIECHKLLEIKDNYHKDLVETSQSLPSNLLPEVEGEVDVEEDKIHNIKRPENFDDVRKYFLEIGDESEAEPWWDHFSANGFVVGKARTPMKDWKATCRTWLRNKQKWGQDATGNSTQYGGRGSQRIRGRIITNDDIEADVKRLTGSSYRPPESA